MLNFQQFLSRPNTADSTLLEISEKNPFFSLTIIIKLKYKIFKIRNNKNRYNALHDTLDLKPLAIFSVK